MKRPWLLPLVPLYAAGVALRSRRFVVERDATLRHPVVSVGSLSAGGAGKTPFVMALAEALRRAGHGVDVLSRGHGRVGEDDLRVDPSGSAERFGDEPLLLAQRLMCPVYVARKRLHAAQMAETDRHLMREDKRLVIHLLDDGFQHRELPRAADIVLFTAEDARDTLLPAGDLREPLRALRRANVIVLRAEEAEDLQPVLEKVFAGGAMPFVWVVQRRFGFVEGKPGNRPLAFCGIARPDGFMAALQGAGVAPLATAPLRDHVRYDDATVARMVKRARALGADSFVTTAKDAVKLTPEMRAALAQLGPLAVGDVSVRFKDEDARVREVESLIQAWWRKGAERRSRKTQTA